MKQGLIGLIFLLAATVLIAAPLRAQEDKPLSPGWLGLESTIGVLDNAIADGKSQLQDALGINISGFLDTSYTWSSNHPRSPANISGRYFDKDHDKLVFNYFHVALEKPEKDWGVGFRLSGDFGRGGELLREATLWGSRLQDEPSAELREAYLTTTIPVGAGLGIKGGLFVTTLGTEILPNPGAYNDNISRSFLFNFAIPLRHLGVLVTYPLLKSLSLNGGIVTGWDNPRDNNDQPSFMAGLGFTPMDMFSLVSNVIYGPEQFDNSGNKRFTMSHVATIKPFDPLAFILEYTYGHEENAALGGRRNATWQGLAGIASYAWTDRFSTAVRGEFFKDADGARLGGSFGGAHAEMTV
ncbi:MAG TPA: outer membrane beta-barrel protein, partial [Candidatus Eisenbacteria bacterium]|nr:outer membrane beta-barrel protein [Candidatus Eisenbacteria bacterium]